MSQVIIAGDTSGTITLQAPAVSGSSVLTLPATTATLATLTTPSFASTIGVGGTTAANTGAGISFPATQSASSDANTLDDYEKGTWTPVIKFGGNSTGITYSSQIGRYTKIGNMVYSGFQFTLSSKGSSTGSASINGMPFTVSTQDARMGSAIGYFSNFAASIVTAYVLMETSSSTAAFRYGNSGTTSDMNDTHFQNTSSMYGVIIYQTA